MDGRQPVIMDTSTLINFLAVDRVDLLAETLRYRFIVTEHAREEVVGHFPEQLACLQAALGAGMLEEVPVIAIDELEMFAQLAAKKQLGPGECASIAAALRRGCALAIDDKLAAKKARAASKELVILNTQQIMVDSIHDGRIDVATADAIKQIWATQYRFLLKITSLAGLI